MLTEKVIPAGALLVRAVPVGGFRMVDGNEADDKIIAVLESDLVYGAFQHVAQLPNALVERLKHYFLTYKQLPSQAKRSVEIVEMYDSAEAHEVINRSMKDYQRVFGQPPGGHQTARPRQALSLRDVPRDASGHWSPRGSRRPVREAVSRR
ncbi:inorganic diphosphatase [Cystobacter fuscus]